MSFTLIDFLNGFQSLKRIKSFSATTQSVYYSILWEFHSAEFPATLDITTRGLQQLAGVKSVSTTHECRNVLKNHRLIDFKTQNGITTYRLLTEHLPNTDRTLTEHQPNTSRTAESAFGLVSCTPNASKNAAAEPAKESSPHTPFKEKSLSDNNHYDNNHYDNNYLDNPPGNNEDKVDELVELWEAAGGSKLNQLLLSKLASLLDTYAYETIKVAINQASESNNSKYGFSFKFLTSILESEKKPERGGEKNGKQYKYKLPEYGDNEPWDSD